MKAGLYKATLLFFLLGGSVFSFAQTFTEILGRPTANSVTISIFFDQKADVFWEYGLTSGSYSMNTSTHTTLSDTALEAEFTGLNHDDRYYYRTRYRTAGTSGNFLAGEEHTFHTQRPRGSSFSFAVEADPHLDTNSNPEAYSLTLKNILNAGPDFMFDLGDNFMSEKLQVKTQANITARHLLYRPYFATACHSVPLYLVIGNHEGENGWQSPGTPTSLPVIAANTRKLFYPNPLANGFYSGDTIPEPYVGLRGNYYSWEWGNALFIVLDPYWYTSTHSEWGWTLGEDQYNWFCRIISTSKAKFKFVFCHQLVGGKGTDGRGGSEFAGFYENGGLNTDSTWGFGTNRQGWAKTVHELMTENHVNIFFHGHDHCYAKQDLDGVVYQEVPQPSSKNITTITGVQYGYKNGVLLPSRGFLLISVSDSLAKVEYIKTFLPIEEKGGHVNGEVAASYTLRTSTASIEEKDEQQNSFQLDQNAPNPFKSKTSITYRILNANTVKLTIFDVCGREITTLVNQYQQPGDYTARLSSGPGSLARGIYYYRLSVGNYSKTMKMICTN